MEPASRRWATLSIVNQILKLTFMIDKTHLAKPYTESSSMMFDEPIGRNAVPFESWNKADRVTYTVYRGRMSILNGEYVTADQKLAYALRHCPKSATKNRRQILIFLIPVRMAIGTNPSRDLLLQHNLLDEFWELSQAVQCGNVNGLVQTLEEHAEFFLDHRIYLMLNSLKSQAWRNLFKRVWTAGGCPRRLSLRDCARAVMLSDSESGTDLDAVSCLASNLITYGFVKGYVWNVQACILLAKENAFPPIQELFSH
eukprot:TRINITY_DN49972_c0_g1_i2.p1 TRINITY_DN49972_c0_g1~~TRINITY_DN49972_c0_g1_i2.p1  ORF type:complete len:256 (+),score=22.85 TRINITY_DN49972_c0_g1_i2:327-1094(+)